MKKKLALKPEGNLIFEVFFSQGFKNCCRNAAACRQYNGSLSEKTIRSKVPFREVVLLAS